VQLPGVRDLRLLPDIDGRVRRDVPCARGTLDSRKDEKGKITLRSGGDGTGMNGKTLVIVWSVLIAVVLLLLLKFKDVMYNRDDFSISLQKSRTSMEVNPPLPDILSKRRYRVETPEGDILYVKATKDTVGGQIVEKEIARRKQESKARI